MLTSHDSNVAAVIIPDNVPVSLALEIARQRGGFLLTNGNRNVVCPVRLRGYAQITGGAVHTSAPEAA